MPVLVQSVGIEMPDDFPVTRYNEILAKVAGGNHQQDQSFHFGGAWNAIAYRYATCARADADFRHTLTEQTSESRFRQDQSLYEFFVNGLSTIDGLFYGLYWIGSMTGHANFPIVAKAGLRNISSDKVMEKFRSHPDANLFAAAFSRLQTVTATGGTTNASEYGEWKDVRNILAHRASYGRIINLSGGGIPSPDDIWRLNDIPINDQLTSSRRTWLATSLEMALEAINTFSQLRL